MKTKLQELESIKDNPHDIRNDDYRVPFNPGMMKKQSSYKPKLMKNNLGMAVDAAAQPKNDALDFDDDFLSGDGNPDPAIDV